MKRIWMGAVLAGVCAAAPAPASELKESDGKMKRIWMGAVLAGNLILAGCGGDKPAATAGTEGSTPAASEPPRVPDEANGGIIPGKVAFPGEQPKMPILDMSANPACERAHKGAVQKSEEVVVNPNGNPQKDFFLGEDRRYPNH